MALRPVDSTPVNAALPSAVLWDMDGTLVDSEPYWIDAETQLIERFGGTWTHEDGLQLVGKGLWVSAEIIRAKGVPWDADRVVEHLTSQVAARIEERVPWRPGARELIREVTDAAIPTALVTMSTTPLAHLVARFVSAELGADRNAFDVIVCGDEVTEPKPHPEAYLTAANRLGVDIADTVAVEDSPTGLASAVASGAAAIAVPHILPIEQGPTYTVWSTLDGRTLTDLGDVLAAHRSRTTTDRGTA